ncbi:hypothetical protein G4Z16_27330 [Streptomyces bathyalis]|uniref:Uncharacterized protein n=1 Tax=Streptomyces bathyalis TaxID=2710756 RepID=A0A7T1TAQ2_9ACTN|nr:hypothetical protein [Streptomyces bathyalis]QPP09513.1 hypothetical protein G4Z16_27330 [Streptomyces bathyalis]
MTPSRTPRDNPLRLVPTRPIAAARRTVTARRRRPSPPPPEGLPPREQLARQARAALADAVVLARWAERNEALPGSGPERERAAAALRMSAEDVRTHWDRARLAGLIELHGGTARPGWRLRAWERDDSAVLRGWMALFDAWSLAYPAPTPADPALVAEVVEAAPQLLSVMHLTAGPVTFPALHDLLAQRVAELRAERDAVDEASSPEAGGAAVTDQAEQVLLPALLDWALDGFAAVGALTRCTDAKVSSEPQGTEGETGVRQGSAVLTPLGNWAVWTKLEQICVAAQSPAGNIEQSAQDMLRGCARLTPGPARDEYRAWIAARSNGAAVTELLAAARGDDALIRGLAFEALRVIGAPAEEAVREGLQEPTLRPYALLWLAELDGADPEDLAGGAPGVLSRQEATWLWVDTAAAVTDHGEQRLLVDHLETAVQGTVPKLLEEVRAVGHPRTVQVLVALAAAHPDPALAKAVRRAAFQVHTGGV